MPDHTVDLLALSLVPGLGDQNVKQLIGYCGSPSAIFSVPKKKLESIPGFGPKLADIIKHHKTHKDAEKILAEASSKGMRVLSYLDSDYPQRLKSVLDAPPILFVKGKGTLNPRRSLAIVGTRKATDYGKAISNKIVEDCQSMDVQIISGLAYGIDIESHRAALKSGMSTVSVLAGGLDWIYPSVHKKNAEQIQENGAIISECVPGTKPDPHLFPARNRIIAGMADAVIVVEAAAKGGALITAKIADSYNRPLFAVPGNIDNEYSKGTNHLISTQMALIYTGLEDLKYQLEWEPKGDSAKPDVSIPELSDEEHSLISLLNEEKRSIQMDKLAIKSQVPINRVASALLSLEFKGLIRSLPGKKFQAV